MRIHLFVIVNFDYPTVVTVKFWLLFININEKRLAKLFLRFNETLPKVLNLLGGHDENYGHGTVDILLFNPLEFGYKLFLLLSQFLVGRYLLSLVGI